MTVLLEEGAGQTLPCLEGDAVPFDRAWKREREGGREGGRKKKDSR